MDATQRRIIQTNYVDLVGNLECSEDFLSHFVPKRILTPDMIEGIMAEKTNKARNRVFLTQVQKKGTHAFHEFYDALVDTYQFVVADLLKPELAPSSERAAAPVQERNSLGSGGSPSTLSSGFGISQVYEEVDQSSSRTPQKVATTYDDDSELSDSLDFFNEEDDTLDFISLRVEPCRKERIRQLYNSNTVYKMSGPTRGRCLIINNSKFERPTQSDQLALSDRAGSDMDVKNISTVFKHLKFKYDQIHKNLSAQQMGDAITAETRNEENENYGMFVLVIMTHGTETHLYGSDGRPFERTKIVDLLNAYNFRAMAGKPKLIILQACSGARRDAMGSYTHDSPGYSGDAQPPIPQIVPSPIQPVPSTWAVPGEYLSTDDAFILEASFSGFVSTRHERQGTWFIRAIVEALYKHACHRDLQTLFEKQVKKKVRKKSMLASQRSNQIGGQQPTFECFTPHDKKLYLFPDYNPRSDGQ